jgi:hypothetical protein
MMVGKTINYSYLSATMGSTREARESLPFNDPGLLADMLLAIPQRHYLCRLGTLQPSGIRGDHADRFHDPITVPPWPNSDYDTFWQGPHTEV